MNAITNTIGVTHINYIMIAADGKLIEDFEINSLQEAINELAEISETFAVKSILEIETGGGSRPNAIDITAHVVRMAVDEYINGKANQYHTEDMLVSGIRHYTGAFRDALEEAHDNGEMKRDFISQSETYALKRAYQGR